MVLRQGSQGAGHPYSQRSQMASGTGASFDVTFSDGVATVAVMLLVMAINQTILLQS